MDTSRRVVEAYWRSRMIDEVTTDEDKVAPVYKLEEICDLLRTSHVSIVKEVSEFILKRLDHKSPIVKQKALRLIKYAVGKSGREFRREIQRHSAAVRQLLHYKGQLDPLKGGALNKAVRDTAQEAISALFASDENKAEAPIESINKRIEGFGNTNYEMPIEERKSFLSEVVGLGSASIIQGLTSLAISQSMKKNDNGTYKGPNLQRSLTTEINSHDKYEPVDEHHGESWRSYGSYRNVASGSWNPNPNSLMSTTASEENSSSQIVVKSPEERLLETIVTSGGVRLQPTRDVLQAFLMEASQLDALAMSRAIEIRLQSHLWQVRMKAICVLESILRKKNDDYCSIMASYFSENRGLVVKCCELPQTSLREKANKVLGLLDVPHLSEAGADGEPTKPITAVHMPDLIDTGDPDDDADKASTHNLVDQNIGDLTSAAPLVDDLFEGAPLNISISQDKNVDDSFADVSFYVAEGKDHNDIFLGLNVNDKKSDQVLKAPAASNSEFNIFGLESGKAQADDDDDKNNIHDLMAGFSLSGVNHDNIQLPINGPFNGVLGANGYYNRASMQYNMQPDIIFNPAFAAQSMNYGTMGAYIAQQQRLFQNIGNGNSGYGADVGIATVGGYSSPLPDIFQMSNIPVRSQNTVVTNSKKEETRAFDFISEHLSSGRDSKRIY